MTNEIENERGATLVEYSLLLGLFVVLTIAVVQQLTEGSGELLQSTGTEYGKLRPQRDEITATQVPPPPVSETTLPPTLLTYVDKNLQSTFGCIGIADTGVATSVSCGGTEPQFTALSNDGDTLTISTGGYGQCLTADPTRDEPVFVTSCGQDGQLWTQTSIDSLTVVYRNESSGTCLEIPEEGPVELGPCTGAPSQEIEVQY